MNKFICCAVLAVLAAAPTTPHYDARFGDAVRQARSAMTHQSARPPPIPIRCRHRRPGRARGDRALPGQLQGAAAGGQRDQYRRRPGGAK
jgi:hypothetical protein